MSMQDRKAYFGENLINVCVTQLYTRVLRKKRKAYKLQGGLGWALAKALGKRWEITI